MVKNVIKDVTRMSVKNAIGFFGFSWSAYWAKLNKTLWVKENSRSGLTLTDSVTPANSPAILLPYVKTTQALSNECFILADNGALDIGATDFTFAMWVKGEDATGGMTRYFGGKNVAAGLAGRYGFSCANTDNKYTALIQSTGGVKTITSLILETDQAWHFLLMDVNLATSKFRFFIDNVQIGADTAFTGTFSALANAYEFYLLAGNASGGAEATLWSKCSIKEAWIYNSLLTPTEQTALYNGTTKIGAKAHWVLLGESGYQNSGHVMTMYDIGGNGYHLTGNLIYSSRRTVYSEYGSQHGLIKGYTLYDNGVNGIYVPNKDDGTELLSPPVPLGFSRIANFAGDLTNHNLANSIIRFAAGSVWDRLAASGYYGDLARAADTNYDSGNTTDWHITELNNLQNYLWANTNYKGVNFVNISEHSYGLRNKLLEIATLTTEATGITYNKVLKGLNDLPADGIYENEFIYWKFDSRVIVGVRGARMLKHDPTNATIYLSLDYGVTFPYSKSVAGLDVIQFCHICLDGTVAFANNTKIFRSADNLATVQEITPLDADGNNYVPSTKQNYMRLKTEPYFDESLYPIAWGNYNNTAGEEYININAWYTIDNFAHIKSFYQVHHTAPDLQFRHIHNITRNPDDGSYWVGTGDGNGGLQDCRWIRFTYNAGTDTWTGIEQFSGLAGSYYQQIGMGFDSGNLYWAAEIISAIKTGLIKCPVVGLADTGNYVQVTPHAYSELASFILDDGEFLITDRTNRIMSSKDLVNMRGSKVFGYPALGDFGAFFITQPKNDSDWYFLHIHLAGQVIADFVLGSMILIKIK